MEVDGTMKTGIADISKLDEADRLIRDIASELGLDFMPQEFDIVPAQKMIEIMAYRLPVNFSHWSFGRDYEIERTKFEHGYAVPYEVVFNSDPCRAYLMDTNPFPIQVLVMAHVYAHNDFMKNNRHFRLTRRDMITSASEAAGRLRQYEHDYGLEAVEELIDAGMALQWNIDPDQPIHLASEDDARERLYGWRQTAPVSSPFDDLIPPRDAPSYEEKQLLRRKTPPEPTIDILGYIIEHSPRRLQEWEKDVLSVIRAQGQYFMPYRRTKIMNEGWATYWHEKIMQRLFSEGFLSADEHGYFNLYNARVKAHNPRSINPYLLGSVLFKNIEDRWNKGRFGREYEEAADAEAKDNWDTGIMKGRRKIFEVRRSHMDWFFIDEFLNEDVVNELNLYLYEELDMATHYEIVVEETEWRRVKKALVQGLMNWGIPRISVVNGDYQGSLQLFLEHSFEGLPLDEEYARKTMEHLYFLWGRPVYLETVELHNNRQWTKRYIIDERGVRTRTL
jgi:stage V sporulation protein R